MNNIYTLKQLKRNYNTDKQCLDFIFNLRFANLLNCLKCGSKTKFYHAVGTHNYKTTCGHWLSPLKDTIFEGTKIDLSIWFYAIFMLSTSKNGVSAKKIERTLGVTYKTAWKIAKEIRTIMINYDSVFQHNITEIDETDIE